jgi:DNA-binding transcriptional LysR family regulator
MELRHLRYFVAVAEMENVSRAALKLHVSQPALSRQIRDLEDELEFPLLERSAKSVRLTEAGRVFLTEARAVLERADQAVKAARKMATSAGEELHVGYAPTLTPRLLPRALRAFQGAMPAIRVKLHDLTTEEMLTGLRQGKLHLGLSVRPASAALGGLRFEELTREPLRFAVGAGHAFARRRAVTVAEAAQQPLLAYSRAEYPDYHELLEEIFSSVKVQPRIAEEHDGVSSLISGLEACTAGAIVPESMSCIAGSRLKLLPLVPDPKPLVVGVIMPKQKVGTPAEKFLEGLRSMTGVKP